MDDDENLQFTGDSINSDAMPVAHTFHKNAWPLRRPQHRTLTAIIAWVAGQKSAQELKMLNKRGHLPGDGDYNHHKIKLLHIVCRSRACMCAACALWMLVGIACANNNMKRYLVNYNGSESLMKCDLHGIASAGHASSSVCVCALAFSLLPYSSRIFNIIFIFTLPAPCCICRTRARAEHNISIVQVVTTIVRSKC